MKKVVITFVIWLPLLLGSERAMGAELVVGRASHVEISGTTNISDWRCKNPSVSGVLTHHSQWEEIDEMLDQVRHVLGERTSLTVPPDSDGGASLAVTMPVRGFDCGSRPMEKDLNHALRSEDHPFIFYRHGRVERVDLKGADSFKLVVRGRIELAGVSREIVFDAQVQELENYRFRITGSIPLKMSTFGVEPPVALFGLIHANDEIVVTFNLLLAPPGVR